jgi:peptidylprolyl isomerase domain and WD repeat-containing protein 1
VNSFALPYIDHLIADEFSSDDDFGPSLPSNAPKKKRRKLPHEKLYVAALPSSTRYSKSLMHRDQLTFVLLTPLTDFLVTASADGVVKFWKKISGTVEFVKEFKAHKDEIKSISVSADGRSLATAGVDKTVKIFDVVTFDLLSMLDLEFIPACVCWVHKRGAPMPLLAISAVETPNICIFDGRGGNQQPLRTLKSLHREPVTSMAFNNVYDCVVSADDGGMIEYWSPGSNYEKPETVFAMKSGTNLFEFKKVRVYSSSRSVSLLTPCRRSRFRRPSR